MTEFRMLINGLLVESIDNKVVASINPGSGETSGFYHYGGIREAELAVTAAREAFDHGPWPQLPPSQRAIFINRLADLLQANISTLSGIESADSGGLIKRTAFDVMQGIRFMRRMSRFSVREFEWKKELPKGAALNPSRNYLVREPIGVCAGIIPWNFPLLMAIWKISMAITTGNTIVLKPSPETPLSALFLGKLIIESGMPPGVVNIITGNGKEVGEYLVQHPLVDRIAFTGSVQTGQSILQLAAPAIKRVSLELGGKSANIILEDADLDMAIDGALFAAFMHSGQVCESGSRLLLPELMAEEIIRELIYRMKNIRIGNQFDPYTQLGPLISEQHLKKIENAVQKGLHEGAVLLSGGKRKSVVGSEAGFYYEPTVFTKVNPGMSLFQDEIFGPVLSIITYKDEEEAIKLANATTYGLAAGIWSRDISRANHMASRLKAGTVWINDWHVFHDFGPFGGYRKSGIGRELGQEGLESYTEIKHIHIGSEGEANAKIGHRVLQDRPAPAGYEQSLPTRIISGPGSISRLAGEIKFASRLFLITDQGVNDTGIIKNIYKIVGDNIAAIFADVPQDSSLETVNNAILIGRLSNVNTIVSVGGGSVIDTGKAVAAALGMETSAEELIGINHLEGQALRHIVIPTTAGSGSEVTNVAVIKNDFLNLKSYIVDDKIFPELAILDAELTLSLPPLLIASTAMDALCHAIEAVMSRKSNPHSDALAFRAISLISKNLERAVKNQKELLPRIGLLNASNLAGLAIVNARVGLVHAMSHALSSLHQIPHGIANGILMPHVIRWNSFQKDIYGRMEQIAFAMNTDNRFNDAESATEFVTNTITRLMKSTNHPVTLKEVGIQTGDLQNCATLAMSDLAILTNTRQVGSIGEIISIYESAL